MPNHICRICSSGAKHLTSVVGSFVDKSFDIYECGECGFIFVGNPWLDYSSIYNENYYRGKGADPLVDYCWEVEHPHETIRSYEWRGVFRVVTDLIGRKEDLSWLDFGCGTGGLVQYLRGKGIEGWGVEEGWGGSLMDHLGIPRISDGELEQRRQQFDVVTAIEVFEHAVDPIAMMKQIEAMLRPGGLLFLTTGNAGPFASRMDKWRYVVPEIHISFFRPRTLERVMAEAGMMPNRVSYGPGWSTIMRFKVLKNVHRKSLTPVEVLVPWDVVGRLLDRRLALSSQPIGWAGS